MEKQISLTIGGLSNGCDVTTPTIRYYEQISLIPKAARNQADQRRYGREDIQRLTFIRRCRDFGFSIKQVKTLLEVPSGSTTTCQASRKIALERVQDIRAKINDLRALEIALNGLITSCDTTCDTGPDKTCAAFIDMKMPA